MDGELKQKTLSILLHSAGVIFSPNLIPYDDETDFEVEREKRRGENDGCNSWGGELYIAEEPKTREEMEQKEKEILSQITPKLEDIYDLAYHYGFMKGFNQEKQSLLESFDFYDRLHQECIRIDEEDERMFQADLERDEREYKLKKEARQRRGLKI